MTLFPASVFSSVGKPKYTYVHRASGENERKLEQGLLNPGQICLLTGPSKTGKTSLYRAVLPKMKRKELIVRCTGQLSVSEFWRSALENLDFEQVAERSDEWGVDLKASIGVEGEAGWPWLAKMLAKVGLEVSSSNKSVIRREIVRSAIGAKHLIPVLLGLPIQLVIEDFHYLSDPVKKEVFQQWKGFIDEGVSVLVVSTTHHAADIAQANPDLTGRTRFIDIGKWDQKDLAEIPKVGFPLLDIKSTPLIHDYIAKESVGLPIITQQICQEIASSRDTSPGSRSRSTNIQVPEAIAAGQYVAENLYTNHKMDYDRLSTGPRKKARKHQTYEKILASFALEPLQFSLQFNDLIERIGRLSLPGEDVIPTGSVTSALRALGRFQKQNEISLMDWHEREKRLYIIEPSFLFYLRQKLGGSSPSVDWEEVLKGFFEAMTRTKKHLENIKKSPAIEQGSLFEQESIDDILKSSN